MEPRDIAQSEIFTDERQWKVRLRELPWGALLGLSTPGPVLGEGDRMPPPSLSWGTKIGAQRRMTKYMAPMAPSQPSELYPMMVAALITNKPEFVKPFLENGVQLKEFVSRPPCSTCTRTWSPPACSTASWTRCYGELERLDPSVLCSMWPRCSGSSSETPQPLYLALPSNQRASAQCPASNQCGSVGQLWEL